MAPSSVVPSGEATLLLEREAQVAALEALAGAARRGGGRFVVIEGSAGIGKTRLPRRGARLPARRVCVCWLPAAGSSRASLRMGSSVSCSSRCWRPRLRISARSCSQDLRHSWNRCSEPRSSPLPRRRPRRARSRSSTALLARRQRGLSPADAARDRRPALGRHALAALAPVPDAKARRSPSPRRRRNPAARGRGARPCTRRRADHRSGGRRDSPRTAWPCLDRRARAGAARSGAGRSLQRRPGGGDRGNPLFVGAVLDAVAREGAARPPSRSRICWKSEGRAFLAWSGSASLACRRRRLPFCARPRSSATGPSGGRRPRRSGGTRAWCGRRRARPA